MRFIDTHCHIHLPAYDNDRDAVISRMREAGVTAITVGTNGISSMDAIALAEKEPDIFAAVGFHPGHVSGMEDEYERKDTEPYSYERLKAIATSSPRVKAIGETGIDRSYLRDLDSVRADEVLHAQRNLFRDHIRLAAELDLPLIIHVRDAFSDIFEILLGEHMAGRKPRAVIHSFTGTSGDSAMFLNLSVMFSVNGIVSFKPKKTEDPSKTVQAAIERMPMNRLMLETDAPWLAPEPKRGIRNEPARVADVAAAIARIRHEELEEVARRTTENAINFYGL